MVCPHCNFEEWVGGMSGNAPVSPTCPSCGAQRNGGSVDLVRHEAAFSRRARELERIEEEAM